jgi:hypothetical protein
VLNSGGSILLAQSASAEAEVMKRGQRRVRDRKVRLEERKIGRIYRQQIRSDRMVPVPADGAGLRNQTWRGDGGY